MTPRIHDTSHHVTGSRVCRRSSCPCVPLSHIRCGAGSRFSATARGRARCRVPPTCRHSGAERPPGHHILDRPALRAPRSAGHCHRRSAAPTRSDTRRLRMLSSGITPHLPALSGMLERPRRQSSSESGPGVRKARRAPSGRRPVLEQASTSLMTSRAATGTPSADTVIQEVLSTCPGYTRWRLAGHETG